MHRESLWEISRPARIPSKNKGLIVSLRAGTGWCLASFLWIKSKARMYLCILAYFNIFMNWILGRTVIQCRCRAALGNVKISDLDFADDVAIGSERFDTIVVTRRCSTKLTRCQGSDLTLPYLTSCLAMKPWLCPVPWGHILTPFTTGLYIGPRSTVARTVRPINNYTLDLLLAKSETVTLGHTATWLSFQGWSYPSGCLL